MFPMPGYSIHMCYPCQKYKMLLLQGEQFVLIVSPFTGNSKYFGGTVKNNFGGKIFFTLGNACIRSSANCQNKDERSKHLPPNPNKTNLSSVYFLCQKLEDHLELIKSLKGCCWFQIQIKTKEVSSHS